MYRVVNTSPGKWADEFVRMRIDSRRDPAETAYGLLPFPERSPRLSTARQHVLRASAATCAVLAALSGAACSAGGSTPAAVTSSVAVAPVASFGGTDLAWVEINIGMDEELLPLLELTPSLSENAQVKALAAEAKAGHEAELAALRALHDQAGLSPVNPHKGMPMPGMVTPEQVAEAQKTRGTAFDALLLEHLRGHLEQGARLARSEQQAGIEAQTLALAKKAESDRIALMAKVEKFS
jgi:hypothetical protein